MYSCALEVGLSGELSALTKATLVAGFCLKHLFQKGKVISNVAYYLCC